MSGTNYRRSVNRNYEYKNLFKNLTHFYHAYNLRINSLCEDASSRRDVVHDFVKCGSFDFFALQIGHGVHEVESDATLSQFTDEQLLLL